MAQQMPGGGRAGLVSGSRTFVVLARAWKACAAYHAMLNLAPAINSANGRVESHS
jgi:hypothetical protein